MSQNHIGDLLASDGLRRQLFEQVATCGCGPIFFEVFVNRHPSTTWCFPKYLSLACCMAAVSTRFLFETERINVAMR